MLRSSGKSVPERSQAVHYRVYGVSTAWGRSWGRLPAPPGIAVQEDDPDVGVKWPVRHPKVSERDAAAPKLAEIRYALPL